MTVPRIRAVTDPSRLEALRSSGLLDTPAEASFDRFTRLVVDALGVPVSLISLVDTDRQFFKSCVGLPEPWATERQTPLSHSFCQHVVDGPGLLLVEDAREHPLVRDNLAIGDLGVVAYAGVPLILPDGQVLGSLCAIDSEPRAWTEREVRVLRGAAEAVMTEIALRIEVRAREQAYAGLAESESRFRSVVDHAAVGIAEGSLYGTGFRLNPALQRFLELPERVSFDSVLSRVHPADLEDHRACLDELLAGERTRCSIELRFSTPARPLAWGAVDLSLSHGSRGPGTSLYATVVDVTERRQAEEERARSEAHYRRLVENAPYGIYVLDELGSVTEINPAGARILGRSADQVIGRHLSEIVAPEDLSRTTAEFQSRLSGERDASTLDLSIVQPGGARRTLRLRGAAIIEGGRVVGTHGIAQDVTETIRVEEERRMLAAVLDGLAHGVSVVDDEGRIRYFNEAYARLLGVEPERMHEHTVGDFLPDEEAGQQLLEVQTALREEGRWSGRLRRRRVSDGRVVTLVVISGTVEGAGSRRLFFSVLHDAAEAIAQEEQLRRVERLASLGTLIAGVAHELNNPLSAIQGFAQLMLMDEHGPAEAEALGLIRREAERAAKIVSDLRIVARQTQEEKGRREAVDLNEVVRHVLKLRSYSLSTHNVEVRGDLAAVLPPVRADRPQLEQVVLNLVVNAEQAMQGQERERTLLLRTRVSNRGATLQVEDSGPGIRKEHLERIFDPFFTTKAPGEGTGLGLSLVHSIVAEHDGQLAVESEVGRGTALRIDLPLAQAPIAPVAEKTSPVPAPGSVLRILVVDDEESIRSFLNSFLSLRGHSVELARDGQDALQRIETGSFDVVLSDLRMPGLGGDQLLARLRKREDRLARRTIFMSGDAASGDAARFLSSVDVPVLYKPFDLERLDSLLGSLAQ